MNRRYTYTLVHTKVRIFLQDMMYTECHQYILYTSHCTAFHSYYQNIPQRTCMTHSSQSIRYQHSAWNTFRRIASIIAWFALTAAVISVTHTGCTPSCTIVVTVTYPPEPRLAVNAIIINEIKTHLTAVHTRETTTF